MRIVFVGMHNKRGFKALDPKTVSGKMIEKIMDALPGHEFMKTNLFNSYHWPEVINPPYVIEFWCQRNQIKPYDLVVSLGTSVNEVFRRAKFPTVKLGHPSRMWLNADQKATYLPRAVEKIKEAMVANQKEIDKPF